MFRPVWPRSSQAPEPRLDAAPRRLRGRGHRAAARGGAAGLRGVAGRGLERGAAPEKTKRGGTERQWRSFGGGKTTLIDNDYLKKQQLLYLAIFLASR